jgi:hypothetical protein
MRFPRISDEKAAHFLRVSIFSNPPMISTSGQILKLEARMPVWGKDVPTTTQSLAAMGQGSNLGHRFLIKKSADHLRFAEHAHVLTIPFQGMDYRNIP